MESDSTKEDDLLDFSEEENEPTQSYELFFADGEVSETDNGLVYKDIMREDEWAYRPGPGQKPTPIPLKVVAGKATTEEEIGMSDLVEAFNDEAIDHVTIPTSHDDKPHENTGYVENLSIVDGDDGKKVLRAGLKFTEPEIKAKALRGSIANTSAGIIFDYIKKDTGKKFKQALGHVALTNKPWLNGMKPFGVLASEDEGSYEITPIMLADVVWDDKQSLTWLRDQVSRAVSKEDQNFYVADVTGKKALVTKFDSTGNDENYVVPFQVRGGEIKVPAQDKWIGASREWVEASLSEEKSYVTENLKEVLGNDDETELSEEAPKKSGAESNELDTGGNLMSSTTKEEKGKKPDATSDDPALGNTDLSDEKVEALKAEFSEQRKADLAEKEELRKKVHAMEVDKRVTELEKIGFADQPGLLGEIRDLMLADSGKPALTLSETSDSGESKELSLSATDVIERIIKALPKSEESGKVNFGEQAISTEDTNKPPMKPDTSTDLSEDERTDAMIEGLGLDLPKTKDGEA